MPIFKVRYFYLRNLDRLFLLLIIYLRRHMDLRNMCLLVVLLLLLILLLVLLLLCPKIYECTQELVHIYGPQRFKMLKIYGLDIWMIPPE